MLRRPLVIACLISSIASFACGEVNNKADAGDEGSGGEDGGAMDVDAGLQGCTDSSECDDGDFCNGAELCDIPDGETTGACVSGTAPDCNDGFDCTADSCDEEADACVHEASDQACDDGQFCNGSETCAVEGGCQDGTAPAVDDGIDCTVDACTEEDGVTHTPDDGACDDGLVCNGVESCNDANGCVSPGEQTIQWDTNNNTSGSVVLSCGESQVVDTTNIIGCGAAQASCKFHFAQDGGEAQAIMITDCGNTSGPRVTSGCSSTSSPGGESTYTVNCCLP